MWRVIKTSYCAHFSHGGSSCMNFEELTANKKGHMWLNEHILCKPTEWSVFWVTNFTWFMSLVKISNWDVHPKVRGQGNICDSKSDSDLLSRSSTKTVCQRDERLLGHTCQTGKTGNWQCYNAFFLFFLLLLARSIFLSFSFLSFVRGHMSTTLVQTEIPKKLIDFHIFFTNNHGSQIIWHPNIHLIYFCEWNV